MKKIKYGKFGKKYLFQNIPLFIILAILFCIAWFNSGKNNLLFWASTTLFILSVIVGLAWDKRRLKHFHCPKCNGIITEPTIKIRKEGDPVNYYCPKCDTEWETGLSETAQE